MQNVVEKLGFDEDDDYRVESTEEKKSNKMFVTKGNENIRPSTSDVEYNYITQSRRAHDESSSSLNFMNITHMGHPQSIPKTQSLDIIKLKNRFKNYQHNDNIIYEVKEEQEEGTPQRRNKF